MCIRDRINTDIKNNLTTIAEARQNRTVKHTIHEVYNICSTKGKSFTLSNIILGERWLALHTYQTSLQSNSFLYRYTNFHIVQRTRTLCKEHTASQRQMFFFAAFNF